MNEKHGFELHPDNSAESDTTHASQLQQLHKEKSRFPLSYKLTTGILSLFIGLSPMQVSAGDKNPDSVPKKPPISKQSIGDFSRDIKTLRAEQSEEDAVLHAVPEESNETEKRMVVGELVPMYPFSATYERLLSEGIDAQRKFVVSEISLLNKTSNNDFILRGKVRVGSEIVGHTENIDGVEYFKVIGVNEINPDSIAQGELTYQYETFDQPAYIAQVDLQNVISTDNADSYKIEDFILQRADESKGQALNYELQEGALPVSEKVTQARIRLYTASEVKDVMCSFNNSNVSLDGLARHCFSIISDLGVEETDETEPLFFDVSVLREGEWQQVSGRMMRTVSKEGVNDFALLSVDGITEEHNESNNNLEQVKEYYYSNPTELIGMQATLVGFPGGLQPEDSTTSVRISVNAEIRDFTQEGDFYILDVETPDLNFDGSLIRGISNGRLFIETEFGPLELAISRSYSFEGYKHYILEPPQSKLKSIWKYHQSIPSLEHILSQLEESSSLSKITKFDDLESFWTTISSQDISFSPDNFDYGGAQFVLEKVTDQGEFRIAVEVAGEVYYIFSDEYQRPFFVQIEQTQLGMMAKILENKDILELLSELNQIGIESVILG